MPADTRDLGEDIAQKDEDIDTAFKRIEKGFNNLSASDPDYKKVKDLFLKLRLAKVLGNEQEAKEHIGKLDELLN